VRSYARHTVVDSALVRRDALAAPRQAERIEAAIVRIMKTRKSLDHQKLVLEASTQLMRHFKPDPKQIKCAAHGTCRGAPPELCARVPRAAGVRLTLSSTHAPSRAPLQEAHRGSHPSRVPGA